MTGLIVDTVFFFCPLAGRQSANGVVKSRKCPRRVTVPRVMWSKRRIGDRWPRDFGTKERRVDCRGSLEARGDSSDLFSNLGPFD
jgi:hypothetical protein